MSGSDDANKRMANLRLNGLAIHDIRDDVMDDGVDWINFAANTQPPVIISSVSANPSQFMALKKSVASGGMRNTSSHKLMNAVSTTAAYIRVRRISSPTPDADSKNAET